MKLNLGLIAGILIVVFWGFMMYNVNNVINSISDEQIEQAISDPFLIVKLWIIIPCFAILICVAVNWQRIKKLYFDKHPKVKSRVIK